MDAKQAIFESQGRQIAGLPEEMQAVILEALKSQLPPQPGQVPVSVGLATPPPAAAGPAQPSPPPAPPSASSVQAAAVAAASGQPAPAPAAAPPPAPPAAVAAAAATAEKPREKTPQFAPKVAPETFSRMPETVYRWSPYVSEGHPLCGLLVNGREPELAKTKDGGVLGVPGRLVLLLTQGSWAYARDGRRVALDAGHRVYLPISDALVPLVAIANHTGGMSHVRITWLGDDPDGTGSVIGKYLVEWELRDGRPRLYKRRDESDANNDEAKGAA